MLSTVVCVHDNIQCHAAESEFKFGMKSNADTESYMSWIDEKQQVG